MRRTTDDAGILVIFMVALPSQDRKREIQPAADWSEIEFLILYDFYTTGFVLYPSGND